MYKNIGSLQSILLNYDLLLYIMYPQICHVKHIVRYKSKESYLVVSIYYIIGTGITA